MSTVGNSMVQASFRSTVVDMVWLSMEL